MPANANPLLQTRKAGEPLRVVSIGECMVELAPTETAGEFRRGFAGDTFNTAWYLRALRPDLETRYVSCVGEDAVSNDMLRQMASSGIDTSHIGRCADRSVGLYMISLQDGERSFSYWRDQSAARMLARDAQALGGALREANLIYFSGITLAILNTEDRQTLLKAVSSAREAGSTVAFDSNLRPRLWDDLDDMRETVMQAATASDIVLPSFDDEAAFFDDADPQATLARYANAGAKTVIVKNGEGAIHYIHEGVAGVVNLTPSTDVIDTTSAGDSFNAGFFAGLDLAAPISQIIKRAALVAGQVIGHKGALVPIDLDALVQPV